MARPQCDTPLVKEPIYIYIPSFTNDQTPIIAIHPTNLLIRASSSLGEYIEWIKKVLMH
jgi:hypothetical protein